MIRFPARSLDIKREESVCQLLVETLDALYSTAKHVTGSPEAAEDLVQETARKALQGAGRLQQDRNLRAWLFRILLNTTRDYLKRKKLWVEREVDPDAEDFSVRALSLVTALDVRNALSALPPPARAVIVLIDVEEFTVLEAASILGLPPGTVCSRLARARSGLRQQLKVYERRKSGQGGMP